MLANELSTTQPENMKPPPGLLSRVDGSPGSIDYVAVCIVACCCLFLLTRVRCGDVTFFSPSDQSSIVCSIVCFCGVRADFLPEFLYTTCTR